LRTQPHWYPSFRNLYINNENRLQGGANLNGWHPEYQRRLSHAGRRFPPLCTLVVDLSCHWSLCYTCKPTRSIDSATRGLRAPLREAGTAKPLHSPSFALVGKASAFLWQPEPSAGKSISFPTMKLIRKSFSPQLEHTKSRRARSMSLQPGQSVPPSA
jgi:hypothetical protein